MFIWNCSSCNKKILINSESPENMSKYSTAFCLKCFNNEIKERKNSSSLEQYSQDNGMPIAIDMHGTIFACHLYDEYSVKGFRYDYYFLSNFYNCDIKIAGITYKNAEAAFQSFKTLNLNIRKKFSDLKSNEAKKLGRQIKLRPDWEKIKDNIMHIVIKAKFEQNIDLKNKLINTKNLYLEETNSWHDTYWGVCNGIGENKLGQILMKVREEFNKIGQVYLCSLSNLDIYKKIEYKCFIVRSPGKIDFKKYNLFHIPELSPSSSLFNKYLKEWKSCNYDWFPLYKEIFEKELQSYMLPILDNIESVLKNGTDVLFICFCKDHKKCHRSIIGDYYKEKNYTVHYD